MMKQATTIFILIIFSLIIIQCGSKKEQKSNDPILLADREAPLGWVYLRIYKDSTFEFESRGLERRGNIYPGNVKIINDTLFFHYKDSIPGAGQTAIYNAARVSYIDGKYPESLSIKLNLISHN